MFNWFRNVWFAVSTVIQGMWVTSFDRHGNFGVLENFREGPPTVGLEHGQARDPHPLDDCADGEPDIPKPVEHDVRNAFREAEFLTRPHPSGTPPRGLRGL